MTADRERVVRELHDEHTDCPGCVADGTCDGLCGWTRGLVAAFDAGAKAERDRVVAWLRKGVAEHREDTGHTARTWCEDYGCSSVEGFATALEAGAHTKETTT